MTRSTTRAVAPGDEGTPDDGTAHRIPGEPGLWVFLLGDMVIFAVMFVAFLVERANDPDLFAAGRASVGMAIAFVNTLVLLGSSLLVVVALADVRASKFSRASTAFIGAIGCGLVFAALKAVEYTHLLTSGHTPAENAYVMWLFVLTGVHLAHLVLGLAVLGALAARARRHEPAHGRSRLVYEGGTCYWHLVDLLWMVLFPVVYLVV